MSRTASPFLCALSLMCACRGDDVPIPDVVASSRYIDYSSWESASMVCMDDALGRLDRFVEQTAQYLIVDPPTARIRYVWIPLPLMSGGPGLSDDWSKWGCAENTGGCYRHDKQLNAELIFSKTDDNFHELVHAIDVSARGPGHFVLVEGIAEYVGTGNSTQNVVDGFIDAFQAMVDGDEPRDYRRSMHFVGSLIDRHGVAGFNALRARVPREADFAAFSDSYADVFGESLEEALATMVGAPIRGRLPFPGCDEAQPLPWTSSGVLETTLHGECGDGWLIGPGAGSFRKYYAVEVETPGDHALTIRGVGEETGELRAILDPCPGVESTGMASSNGATVAGTLSPGRHVLRVWFPPNDEGKVLAELSLRNTDI